MATVLLHVLSRFLLLQVFDPNHTSPVSISQLPLGNSHKISVISTNFSQKSRPKDNTIQTSVEKSNSVVIPAEQDVLSHHSIYVDGNSNEQGCNVSTDDSNKFSGNSTGCIDHNPIVNFPEIPPLLDVNIRDSTGTLQVTDEVKTFESYSCDNKNTNTNVSTRDKSLDAGVNADTHQEGSTSDNAQISTNAFINCIASLDQSRPSNNGGYVRSIHNPVVPLIPSKSEEPSKDDPPQFESGTVTCHDLEQTEVQNHHDDQQSQSTLSIDEAMNAQQLYLPNPIGDETRLDTLNVNVDSSTLQHIRVSTNEDHDDLEFSCIDSFEYRELPQRGEKKIEQSQVEDLPSVTSGGKVASAYISTNISSTAESALDNPLSVNSAYQCNIIDLDKESLLSLDLICEMPDGQTFYQQDAQLENAVRLNYHGYLTY